MLFVCLTRREISTTGASWKLCECREIGSRSFWEGGLVALPEGAREMLLERALSYLSGSVCVGYRLVETTTADWDRVCLLSLQGVSFLGE